MLFLYILTGYVSTVIADPRYLTGNALDDFNTPGPNGELYPRDLIDEMLERGDFGPVSPRGRSLYGATLDPDIVSSLLLNSQQEGARRESKHLDKRSVASSVADRIVSSEVEADLRVAKTLSADDNSTTIPEDEQLLKSPSSSCAPTPPAQLCPTKFNTTAPLWGISLTSGKRVTIVQKFPDLLQQVIYHECISSECDVIHGECKQTYTPYLFLVIPLGPVTLTGQDYVMVESGCACQPKYSRGQPYEYNKENFLG